jgi:putative transposase
MNKTESQQRTRVRAPNNPTTTGFRISDELWAALEPLLPQHASKRGRPRVPDRRCADAIFYVLRTGCQWQALDQTELGPHSTAHDRFQEWVRAGVFFHLWRMGVWVFDELVGIDWAWLVMDGAMTKAPLGGEKKDGPQSDRSRQARRQTQSVDRGAWRPVKRHDRRRQPA